MAITVKYKLTISRNEAITGTKKVITRKGKRLEVTIPAGVKTGTLVKLSGALQITDGYYGDILIQIKVKGRHRHRVLVAASAALAIVCLFIGMYFLPDFGSENVNEGTDESTQDIYDNGSTGWSEGYIIHDGGIEVGGDGEPIELINNPDAANPTYDELVAFIMWDTTDTNSPIEKGPGAYVCADFAEDVHNNAEAAGIRAAWVGVDFEGEEYAAGHALNAFETADGGLVYIDCTEVDCIAYVEEGKEYKWIIIGGKEWVGYVPPGIVENIYIFW